MVFSAVEKLVSRWAHNPKATGSNPVRATIYFPSSSDLLKAANTAFITA